ncbi:hypothetical protein FRX31_005050 [Thalictrum thalictroides]|uniref:MATH domain-containing protein n=1 Tax=Thalictrum thalictroides TaxID=46969 RepID=A0A7J6X7J5_THATH|nr:hypothetical protein FRX31_005050 [Thalictrum thalictroides]
MASLPAKCCENEAEVLASDTPKLSVSVKIESFSLLYNSSQKLVQSMEFYCEAYSWRFYIYPEGPPKARVCFALEFDGRLDRSPLPCWFKVDAKFNVYIYNHFKNNFIKISGNQGSAVRVVARKM